MMNASGQPGTLLHFPPALRRAFDGMGDTPLVTVEAPMGYGKTTAVRTHLAAQDRTVLWLQVFDASPIAFWQDFCGLFAGFDAASAARMAQAPPVDATTLRAAFRTLASMPFPRPLTVVVDDYHAVGSAQTDACFTQLAQARIPGLQILLVARAIGMPAREELRLKGHLHVIDKHAFVFAAEDIAAFCRLNGATLRKSEAESLHTWSEGWISALYLALLAHAESGRWETTLHIDGLIRTAIHDPLSQREQRILRQMSLFDRFTPAQADHVCADADAGAILLDLVRRNAFIRYDAASGEMEIHRLFNGFLRERLAHDPLEVLVQLHDRAGAWFLSRGSALAAMRHFHAAGNADAVLAALETDRGASLRMEQKAFLLEALESCPDAALDRHPVALLSAAMCLTTFDEMDHAFLLAGRIRTNLESGMYEPAESARLAAELTLFSSFGQYNDVGAMVECCREAAVHCDLPVRFLDTAGSFTFDAPSIHYMFHREPGRLHETVAAMKNGLCHYQRLTGGHGTGADTLMEAEMHFLQGEVTEAAIGAHRARREAVKARQTDIAVAALFLLARIAMTSGSLGDMQSHLDAMSGLITADRAWALVHTQDMCRGYLYGCLQKPEEIPEWLCCEEEHFEARLFFQAQGFARMVQARALLLRSAHLRLIGCAEDMLASIAVFPSQAARIQILICRAAAGDRAFRPAQALADMTQALDEAAQDDLLMPFVENGDLALPLLAQLHGQNIHRAFIDRIQQVAASIRPAMEVVIRGLSGQERPRLSEREAQVATMAAEGRSNREIGQILHISENTVKTLLKNVFEKLGIHSRALLPQALADGGVTQA